MKKKFINEESFAGRLYQFQLKNDVVKSEASANYGKPKISGWIEIATDDECLNVVRIDFPFGVLMYKFDGKTANPTYNVLEEIINSGKTVTVNGKENATLVRVSKAAFALNDFLGDNGEMVSYKINSNGWVSILDKLPAPDKRNSFSVDMFINSIQEVEADEEKGILEDYIIIKGCTFNYNGSTLLPIECSVRRKDGINYFEGLDISGKNPIFTNVKGEVISQTIVKTETVDVAFGEPTVKESHKKNKEWLVTSAASLPYDLGDADTAITIEEIKELKAKREVYLADRKKNSEEYNASKSGGFSSSKTIPVVDDDDDILGGF